MCNCPECAPDYEPTIEEIQQQAVEQYKAELVEWLKQELETAVELHDYRAVQVIDEIIQRIEADHEKVE